MVLTYDTFVFSTVALPKHNVYHKQNVYIGSALFISLSAYTKGVSQIGLKLWKITLGWTANTLIYQ